MKSTIGSEAHVLFIWTPNSICVRLFQQFQFSVCQSAEISEVHWKSCYDRVGRKLIGSVNILTRHLFGLSLNLLRWTGLDC